jgi:hypothetical protein
LLPRRVYPCAAPSLGRRRASLCPITARPFSFIAGRRSSVLARLPVPRPCACWISRARCPGPDRARLQLEPILCPAPASSQLEFPLWARASRRVSKPWLSPVRSGAPVCFKLSTSISLCASNFCSVSYWPKLRIAAPMAEPGPRLPCPLYARSSPPQLVARPGRLPALSSTARHEVPAHKLSVDRTRNSLLAVVTAKQSAQ